MLGSLGTTQHHTERHLRSFLDISNDKECHPCQCSNARMREGCSEAETVQSRHEMRPHKNKLRQRNGLLCFSFCGPCPSRVPQPCCWSCRLRQLESWAAISWAFMRGLQHDGISLGSTRMACDGAAAWWCEARTMEPPWNCTSCLVSPGGWADMCVDLGTVAVVPAGCWQ